MIGLSFILGNAAAAIALKMRKVPNNIIIYSVALELTISMYLGVMFAYLLAGGKSYGLNSTGGAVGILLGALIFSKITPMYKDSIFSAYILALPLMYGLGKIGCAFAGCCGGIGYNGLLHVHGKSGNVFPIQAVEAAVFLILFAISAFFFLKRKYSPAIAAVIYALVKILLDFLRDTHAEHVITANQIMCMAVVAGIVVGKAVRKDKRKGSASGICGNGSGEGSAEGTE